MRSFFTFGHDQYWRIALTYPNLFHSLFFWRHSRSLYFIWTEKKMARDRYLPTFNYTTTTKKRKKCQQSKSHIYYFFFDGAYLINVLNRFNSERTRSKFRKQQKKSHRSWVLILTACSYRFRNWVGMASCLIDFEQTLSRTFSAWYLVSIIGTLKRKRFMNKENKIEKKNYIF